MNPVMFSDQTRPARTLDRVTGAPHCAGPAESPDRFDLVDGFGHTARRGLRIRITVGFSEATWSSKAALPSDHDGKARPHRPLKAEKQD
jgi:hypothetical protein